MCHTMPLEIETYSIEEMCSQLQDFQAHTNFTKGPIISVEACHQY